MTNVELLNMRDTLYNDLVHNIMNEHEVLNKAVTLIKECEKGTVFSHMLFSQDAWFDLHLGNYSNEEFEEYWHNSEGVCYENDTKMQTLELATWKFACVLADKVYWFPLLAI